MSELASRSNNLAQVLSLKTPTLVIDPEGTRCRENSVTLDSGNFRVSIVLPPKRLLSLSEYKLIEFAERTFSLSSIVPLQGKNADFIASQSIKQGTGFSAIEISFNIQNPFNADLKLIKNDQFEILDTQQFPDHQHFHSFNKALEIFIQQLDPQYKDKLVVKRKAVACQMSVTESMQNFEQNFALLHNHAYHLAHVFLKTNGIPHIYMSADDNFRNLFFGTGHSDGISKAALGSPLRKIAGFINSLQLACYLHQKTILFRGQHVGNLTNNINELKSEAHHSERKKVISKAVSILNRGPLEYQPAEFKNRIYLLIDHLAHSAPLPADAWKLLLYEAIPGAVKKQILQHASDNPAYAHSLLSELNRCGRICEKKIQIKEDIDFSARSVKLKLFIKHKENKSETKSSYEFSAPLDNFFDTLHRLRLEAIQKIAGYAVKLEASKPVIPYQIVSSANYEAINEYVRQHINKPLEQIEYKVLIAERWINDLSYFQIEFIHNSGQSYTYETAPINKQYRENPALAITELLNFVAKKMREFGLSLERPVNDFESDLPASVKESGLNSSLLKVAVSEKGEHAYVNLEYKVRLIGNHSQNQGKISQSDSPGGLTFKDHSFKKSAPTEFNFRQAREEYQALQLISGKSNKLSKEHLYESLSPVVDREIEKFLREISFALGLTAD